MSEAKFAINNRLNEVLKKYENFPDISVYNRYIVEILSVQEMRAWSRA